MSGCGLNYAEDVEVVRDLIVQCLECANSDCIVQKVKVKINKLGNGELTIWNLVLDR